MAKSQFSFSNVSSIYMSRRKFNKSHKVTTTMSVGKLYPIDVQEVLPGDGWYTKLRHLDRLSTAFLRPVMDSFFMDTYHFFVPLRLLYEDYERVFGNASPNAYVNEDLKEFPTLPTCSIFPKTVGDYLGLPTNVRSGGKTGFLPKGISVLKFRAFAEIYEQWFRNQNTVQPMFVQKGEYVASELPNNAPWSPTNYVGQLPYVNKFNDYFTSCLPAPQKGSPVSIGSAVFPATDVWVNTSERFNPLLVGSEAPNKSNFAGLEFVSRGTIPSGNDLHPLVYGGGGDGSLGVPSFVTVTSGNYSPIGDYKVSPANLVASIPETSLTAVNVNDLRFAVQLQKMLEKDARGGGRYREYLLTHFGVNNADSRMQVPEYLGGQRTPLNLQQVAQTSSATADSPLASLGAYSQTYGKSRYSKSFTEHGFIFTLACIRYKHSYQQGIDKSFFRSKREDFYDPLFANLGEQPVYKSQLFAYDNPSGRIDDTAFGYNEAWADYRYAPDIVTGEMRSNAPNTFDIWHFADEYENAPTLTADFTNETPEFFRRTTVVSPDADVDDFLCEFYFDSYVLRTMPIRSTPGLLDHH